MPKHERGSYRSILEVLIDSPEYLALSANARLMLFVVKMRLGPIGIAVVPGMLAALTESTGLTPVQAADALSELESDGWVKTQGNMIWLVNGLKYEPAYSANNMWHVKKIHEMLDALPRVPLVQEFKNYYAAYLGVQPKEPEEIEHPVEAPKRPAKAKAPADKTTWVTEGVAWWSEHVGAIAYGRFGTGMKALVQKYGWERVFEALKLYVAEAKGDVRIEWFCSNGVRYIEQHTKKAVAAKKPQWQIEEEDAGLARAPHVGMLVKQYKESLNGKGEEWWTQMVQRAKASGRHPIVYAYEIVQEEQRQLPA